MTTAFGGRILDTTALLDIATGTTIYTRSLVDTATTAGLTLAVPAAALAAAWGASTPAARLFLDLLLDLPVVLIEPLDAAAARVVGVVLAGARSTRGFVPLDTAHVVASARARGWPVVTAEPGRLLALAGDVDIEAVP